ncbi:MAG: sodium:proton antiporter [Sedimentisphaerales bacterium]|nr:sodium:proton antiporter [Sedimentisphaerales bacterium]
MREEISISLACVIILGIVAQFVAWRFRLPAILLLLLFGILAGPVTGYVDPDTLFGNLLFPMVSLAVAVILFEGGLSLRLTDLKGIGHVVWLLVTVGALTTWVVTTCAAVWLLKFDLQMAILLGAILIVTGPTVIIPLLRHVRPNRKIGSIVKWEGIIIDPIGALAAVLTYEAVRRGGGNHTFHVILLGLGKTILLGGGIGVICGHAVARAIQRFWLPELLQNSIVLVIVLACYIISSHIQAESGLFAVTVMGIWLANQKGISIESIIHFKEDLRVLLISILFIVLSARLKEDSLVHIQLSSLLFLGVLIFMARPAAVALSTLRSGLSLRERLFLAWMAPRGIVAAAVSSVFALRLIEEGNPDAGRLMPMTFLVIVGTVTFYGLTASLAGRWLGVSQPHPQGVLILGAHHWAREIAQALAKTKFAVTLVDTNWEKVNDARMEGLSALYGNVFTPRIISEVETASVGRLLALTINSNVNSLASVQYSRLFGNKEVYQLPPEGKSDETALMESAELHGRYLFGSRVSYEYLGRRFLQGAIVKTNTLTEEFDYDAFRGRYGEHALPFFLIHEDHQLEVFTTDYTPEPKPGDILISLVDPA